MSDQRDDLKDSPVDLAPAPTSAPGPNRIGALELAAREILRAGDAAFENGQPQSGPSAGASSDGTRGEGRESAQSDVATSRPVQPAGSPLARALAWVRSLSIRTFVIAGVLLALVTAVAVSSLASHKSSGSDVVAQGCVAHVSGPGAEATVVVTNHGNGTASYMFDVVFSQNQSPVERVPAQVSAVQPGASQTFHASSGSLDTSKPYSCTLANVHRLAA